MSVINGQPRQKRFATVRLGGYDVAEVDRAFDILEQAVLDGEDVVRSLREQVAASEQRLQVAEAEVFRLRAEAPAAPGESGEDAARSASQSATRLLEIAARGADELTADARQEAARLLSEARAEATRLLAGARGEADRQRRENAERRSEAEAEVERLVAFERESRQRLVTWFRELLETVDEAPQGSRTDAAEPPVVQG